MTRFFVLLCTLLSQINLANSESFSSLERSVVFEALKIDGTLYSETLVFDKNNTLWIGTQNGVTNFDGFSSERYLSFKEDLKVTDNYILNLFSTKSGRLFASHREGVDEYNFSKKYFEPLLEPSNKIKDPIKIIEDKNQNLWLLTKRNGIYQWREKENIVENYLFNGRTEFLYIDKNENIYVEVKGEDNGLYKYSYKENVFKEDSQKSFVTKKSQMYSINENTYIFGGQSLNQIVKKDSLGNWIEDTETLECSGKTLALLSNNDDIWIGTTSGICSFQFKEETNKYEKISESNSLGIVTDIKADRLGTIWIATSSGVYFSSHNNSHIETWLFKNGNSVKSNYVTTFEQTLNGNLAVGKWEGGIEVHNSNNYQLPSDVHVAKLLTDHLGNLWVGTFRNGVYKFDKNGVLLRNFPLDGDANFPVNSIVELKNNDLVLGTFGGGLYRIEQSQEKAEKINYSNKVSDYITGVVVSDTNTLILSTYDEGVFELVSSIDCSEVCKIRDFDLPSVRIMGITLFDKYLLASSQDEGLIVMNNYSQPYKGGVYTIDYQMGLPSNSIFSALFVGDSNIWISHSEGLSVYNINKNELRNFVRADGLQSYDYNAGSFFQDSVGSAYFGGSGGFNKIPKNIDLELSHQPLEMSVILRKQDGTFLKKITGIKNNKIKIKYNERIQLSAFVNDLSKSSSSKFKYKWDGEDKKYYNFGETNKLMLSSLSVGNHTLLISHDLSYSPSRTSEFTVYIEVLPPVWRSSLAYFFYALLILSSLFFYVAYKSKVRKRVIAYQNKLENTVKARTLELEKMVEELNELKSYAELKSNTDHLTGLANRRHFNTYLKKLLTKQNGKDHLDASKLVAIIILDIDFFKKINDTFGHEIGDRVIVSVANGIRSIVRDNDIAVRWGGEEFLVVANVNNINDVSALGKRVIESINGQLEGYKSSLGKTISCSAGSFYWPVRNSTPQEWSFDDSFKLADFALLYAKENGRNNFTCAKEGSVPLHSVGDVHLDALIDENKIIVERI